MTGIQKFGSLAELKLSPNAIGIMVVADLYLHTPIVLEENSALF